MDVRLQNDQAQLQFTIQHRTVLIMYSITLQRIITSQMLSIGGKGVKLANIISQNPANTFLHFMSEQNELHFRNQQIFQHVLYFSSHFSVSHMTNSLNLHISKMAAIISLNTANRHYSLVLAFHLCNSLRYNIVKNAGFFCRICLLRKFLEKFTMIHVQVN